MSYEELQTLSYETQRARKTRQKYNLPLDKLDLKLKFAINDEMSRSKRQQEERQQEISREQREKREQERQQEERRQQEISRGHREKREQEERRQQEQRRHQEDRRLRMVNAINSVHRIGDEDLKNLALNVQGQVNYHQMTGTPFDDLDHSLVAAIRNEIIKRRKESKKQRDLNTLGILAGAAIILDIDLF